MREACISRLRLRDRALALKTEIPADPISFFSSTTADIAGSSVFWMRRKRLLGLQEQCLPGLETA